MEKFRAATAQLRQPRVGQLAPAESESDSSDASSSSQDLSDCTSPSPGSSEVTLKSSDTSKSSISKSCTESSATVSDYSSTSDAPEREWICPNCDVEYVVKAFESPIPLHLLKTNHPPKQEEEYTLKETLSNVNITGELANTREAIRSLRATLCALERRESQLQQTFVASMGIFSPIRRIPREIVGEIILHAIGFYSSSMDRVSLNTRVGVWVYTHVCRLWRSEVLSRATVWSKVEISQKHLSAQAFRVVHARARESGLDLSIKLYQDDSFSRSILDSLVAVSQSWIKVQFDLDSKLFACLKRLKNRIPKLLSVDICYRSLGPGITSANFRDFFMTAPALRYVTFQGIRNLDELSLPWSQITHFCGYSRNRTHTVDLLHRMSRLTHYYGDCEVVGLDQDAKITLPSLQSLTTFAITNPDFLNLLITPNLKELHSDIRELDVLAGLIRRSSCTIMTLTIKFSYLTLQHCRKGLPDAFSVLCQAIPQLTTLYFYELKSQTSWVGHDLLAPLADAACLPKLHTLVFDSLALKSKESCKAIRRLVKQRRKESSTLQELRFVYNPNELHSSEKDFLHIFNGLRARNLKVLLTGNTNFPFAPNLSW